MKASIKERVAALEARSGASAGLSIWFSNTEAKPTHWPEPKPDTGATTRFVEIEFVETSGNKQIDVWPDKESDVPVLKLVGEDAGGDIYDDADQ